MFGSKPVIQCFSFWGDIQNLSSIIRDFKKEDEAFWYKETPFFFEIQNEMYYMEIIFQGPLNSTTGNWENNEVVALPGMSRI